MRRTAIGSTVIPEAPYWSGGRNADRLRQSEREIYSMIDLFQEICNYTEDESVINEHYNDMDKLYVALQLIERYGRFPEHLTNAGRVWASFVASGTFTANHSDLESRNAAIDELIEIAFGQIDNGEIPNDYSEDALNWWVDVVEKQNFYINIETGNPVTSPVVIAGLAGTNHDQYAASFKKGGFYYLYVAAPLSQVDTVRAFNKRQGQSQTIDAFIGTGVGLTRATIMNNVNAGIISRTGGQNASQALEEFKRGRAPRIGSVIALITAVLSIILAIIEMVKANRAARERVPEDILNERNLEKVAPAYPDDWDGDGVRDYVAVDPNTGRKYIVSGRTGEIIGEYRGGIRSGMLLPLILGAAALVFLIT